MVALPTALLLVWSFSLCTGIPKDNENSHYSSSSDTVTSGGGYHVSLSKTEVDGACTTILSILGHGIRKEARYPCFPHPQTIIALNNTLLVGDEYFSDTHAVLVHITGDSCQKELFHTDTEGRVTSTVTPMDDKDCEKVRFKASVLREQLERWQEWTREQQHKTQEQLAQLQNNLAALQMQLFGALFAPPFG